MVQKMTGKKERHKEQMVAEASEGAWWTVSDVIGYLKISRATVWRWTAGQGTPEGFPLPAQFSDKIYRWKAEDIVAWAEGRAA